MSFDQGIDFRGTSGYVSDPSGCTYNLGEAYPVVRGGFTSGWSSVVNITAQDLDNTLDARIAGFNYFPGGTNSTFQIDLASSGSVAVAMGARQNPIYDGTIVVKDNTTTLFTVTASGSGTAGHIHDANDADFTLAAWPAGQTANTQTFSTTTLKALVTGISSYCTISHIRATQAAANLNTARLRALLGVGS